MESRPEIRDLIECPICLGTLRYSDPLLFLQLFLLWIVAGWGFLETIIYFRVDYNISNGGIEERRRWGKMGHGMRLLAASVFFFFSWCGGGGGDN